MKEQRLELSKMQTGKTIIVGVTGGIAAYKAAELVSCLVKMGHNVHVILTKAALDFITPLTLQTLAKNPVLWDEQPLNSSLYVPHIELAEKADLLVVVPATANTMAKVATGMADNLLTSIILATQAPILLAPAMNVNMYEKPITQKNLQELKSRGVHFVEPEEGLLACGTVGRGRLAAIPVIIQEIERLLYAKKDFQGKKVLVTAGGTREAIDPVRYIGNRSSGKMGFALAREAYMRGAEVIIIAGVTSATPPNGVKLVQVESAAKMQDKVLEYYPHADVVFKAAAVADFRPSVTQDLKIKKAQTNLTLQLCPTTDILAQLGKEKNKQILIGFAAETNQVVAHAKKKLQEKNVDLLVANDVLKEGAGFEVDTNIVSLVYPDGQVENLPMLKKSEIAALVLDRVATLPRFSI